MGRKHPNVLKAATQKRMRRAYLKEFNGIAVPRKISQNTPAPSNDGLDYTDMYAYRRRGKGFYDPYWNALFPGVKQDSQWRSTATEPKAIVTKTGLPYPNQGEDNKLNGRKYCMTRAEEERIVDMLADEADEFLTVREGGITKTRLTWMYNRKKTRNFFVETCLHPSGGYIKRSMVYCAEERAMFALKNNRIEWLEHLPLATQEPDPPSG